MCGLYLGSMYSLFISSLFLLGDAQGWNFSLVAPGPSTLPEEFLFQLTLVILLSHWMMLLLLLLLPPPPPPLLLLVLVSLSTPGCRFEVLETSFRAKICTNFAKICANSPKICTNCPKIFTNFPKRCLKNDRFLNNFRIYGTPPSPGVYNDTNACPLQSGWDEGARQESSTS